MNDSKQILTEKIEAYLKGKLEGENLRKFEAQLKKDPKLVEQVKLHEEINYSMESEKGEAEFRKILEEEGQAFAPKTAKVRSINRFWLATAAGILLLIAAFFVFQNLGLSATKTADQLFAQAYETPALLVVERSNDPSINEKLQAAYLAYNMKDFTLAAQEFAKLQAPKSEIKYYAAISYLSAEPAQIQKAIKLLDEVSKDDNSSYQPAAKWYLALAILKQGDKEAAKKLFEEIERNGTTNFKKKASNILKEY